MKFVVASKNLKKLEELNRILIPLGIDAVSEANSKICLPEVDETGKTFIENARLKALSALQATGLPAIADDTGLCVEYLNGAPGIYSARYAGEHVDYEKNNQKLLLELKNVPMDQRGAYFICAVYVAFPNGDEIVAEGKVYGKIAFEPTGDGGFGYDPLFLVGDKSFAQMSAQQKDQISHRGRALKILEKKLKEYINVNK